MRGCSVSFVSFPIPSTSKYLKMSQTTRIILPSYLILNYILTNTKIVFTFRISGQIRKQMASDVRHREHLALSSWRQRVCQSFAPSESGASLQKFILLEAGRVFGPVELLCPLYFTGGNRLSKGQRAAQSLTTVCGKAGLKLRGPLKPSPVLIHSPHPKGQRIPGLEVIHEETNHSCG